MKGSTLCFHPGTRPIICVSWASPKRHRDKNTTRRLSARPARISKRPLVGELGSQAIVQCRSETRSVKCRFAVDPNVSFYKAKYGHSRTQGFLSFDLLHEICKIECLRFSKCVLGETKWVLMGLASALEATRRDGSTVVNVRAREQLFHFYRSSRC